MTITDYDSCKKALAYIPHRVQVLLAHKWALSVLHIFEKNCPNDKRPRNCLDLVFKWIVDPTSVGEEQLRNIANTTYTAYVAANAANAVYAAAHAASTAAYAAAYAAASAAYAVYATANAANWQYINDTFNQCYCPDLVFDNNWKTSTVIELAKTIFNNNCLDLCPVLADALEDAGCTETKILERLRNADILRSEWIIWNLLNLGEINAA
jgi:hypothetical protein